MKYIYLVNRFNFKDKTAQIVDRLKKTSEEFGRSYEIIVSDTRQEALSLKDRFKDSSDIVTAIGGDGSVNHILNQIVGTKNILSYIPIGTGNDFYRANLEDLEDGVHDVDIIRINERYFINVACFGIDADIANDEKFIHNRFIPESMRYNAGVVYHFLTYKPRKMKIECGDQVIEKELTTAVVGNAKYYGGGYNVSPKGKIDDGVMEILLVDRLNKIRMANIILSMKNAGHLSNPALHTLTGDKVIISSDEVFGANIDGETLKSDRFELEMIPKGIKLDFDRKFTERMRSVKYK